MEAAIIAVGGSWRETKVVFKWEGCSVLWDKVKGWRETKVVFKLCYVYWQNFWLLSWRETKVVFKYSVIAIT